MRLRKSSPDDFCGEMTRIGTAKGGVDAGDRMASISIEEVHTLKCVMQREVTKEGGVGEI